MIYKLTTKDGKEEEVVEERWGWGVVYKDGSEARQFGLDGIFHRFAEINQDEVKMFAMYRTDDQGKRFDIEVKDGMQIFHFYRNFCFDYLSECRKNYRVYCFGWKDRKTGAMAYFYIMPDDRIVSGNFDLDISNYGIGA
ncbi:MAG: hypothetical protein WC450_09380 [Candidatus Omnitrophota bacterium]|jgi:hypothetical protein